MRRPLLALLAVLALPVPAQAADGLRAGAASADITPPVGTPMFAYTARSKVANPAQLPETLQVLADPDTHLYAKSFVPSEGFHTRLRARALVLEQGGERLALVQADLGGVPYALLQAAADLAGFPRDRVLLSASHTHSGTGPIWPADNMGYGVLGGDLFDPRAFRVTARGIADAIDAAEARLVEARAGVGTAELRGASRNRELEPHLRNPEVPDDPEAARPGSVDPTVTVLRVDDRRGRSLAVWSNFAIHPTSFGADQRLFSGDNAGIAAELVERALREEGDPERPPVNVWTNGHQGDVSPDGSPRTLAGEAADHGGGGYPSAHLAGAKVADGILAAWRDARGGLRGDLELGVRKAFLAFDGSAADGQRVGPFPVLGAGVVSEGQCSPVQDLAGPGQGNKLPVAGGPLIPSIHPVGVWRLGPLAVASVPSEVTTVMGRRIREAVRAASGAPLTAMAGLSDSYMSYTATPDEYDACTYEGGFTLFGRQQGARFRDALTGLAGSLFKGGPAPAGAPEPPPLAAGTMDPTPARATPDAGKPVAQPPAAVTRFERVAFSWEGGDPALDAPRGEVLARVERLVDGEWRTHLTDETAADTTRRAAGDVWTHTWQTTACTPAGTFRVRITGRADKGAGPVPYEVASSPVEVRPLRLEPGEAAVAGGVATARVRYPAPGPGALLALPRLVTEGQATFELTRPDGTTRRARASAADGVFRVPAGDAVAARVVEASDACGNAA
jgi:neutral ceramidase